MYLPSYIDRSLSLALGLRGGLRTTCIGTGEDELGLEAAQTVPNLCCIHPPKSRSEAGLRPEFSRIINAHQGSQVLRSAERPVGSDRTLGWSVQQHLLGEFARGSYARQREERPNNLRPTA